MDWMSAITVNQIVFTMLSVTGPRGTLALILPDRLFETAGLFEIGNLLAQTGLD